MNKRNGIILLLLLQAWCGSAQGVFKRLKDKAAQAAEQATGNKITKAIDTAIEGKKGKANSGKGNSGNEKAGDPGTDAGVSKNTGVQSYSRYDFIPGNTVLFGEDFSQDVIGEFPLKWFTQSSGEVVTIDGQEGKWLKMIPGGSYLSPMFSLKDNYTIEFDLLLDVPKGGAVPAGFGLNFYDNGNGKFIFNAYDFRVKNNINLALTPRWEGKSLTQLLVTENGESPFKTPIHELPALDTYFGRPVHVAITVQKQRLRLWFNEEKLFDVPNVVPEKVIFNQMKLEMSSRGAGSTQNAYYVSNFKMAAGQPDTRSKLLTEGKLVTTAITFDVNSDRIRPLSYPVLKEIAQVLKEEATLNIKIIGHTDSDGEAASNLDLSKRRAMAVRKFLVSEFGVAENRMQTDGKGEADPADKGTTPAAKANNRRVEFIKL